MSYIIIDFGYYILFLICYVSQFLGKSIMLNTFVILRTLSNSFKTRKCRLMVDVVFSPMNDSIKVDCASVES